MSTQCRFCGEAVRPDSMFCPACGQLTGMAARPAPPFPASAAKKKTDAAPAPVSDEPPPPVPLPARRWAKAEEPAADETPSAPPPASAILLPGGATVALDRTLVLGRAPELAAAEHGGTPVALDDPQRAMSRVHLVVSPTGEVVTATDPGSANGTVVERAGTAFALQPGAPTPLLPGDRLLLGDAVVVVS
ncbi:MAG: FHA domain-containing protein [Microbacterium sp.]|uniref:FHA domain-containing protein n=1 Tax=Microbacterium sp. TaxID=51671 RepID=UPI0039E66281